MSIEESNKLIAEFMGAELDGEDWHITGREWTVSNKRYPGNLQYHTSWDWLMPVIEKIESHGCIVNISICLGRMCNIIKPTASPLQIAISESNSLIDAVYDAATQFIQWHNQQSQPEGKGKEGEA